MGRDTEDGRACGSGVREPLGGRGVGACIAGFEAVQKKERVAVAKRA